MVTLTYICLPGLEETLSCTCGCVMDISRKHFGSTREGVIDHLLYFVM
jgi:hypothetical protein